METSFELAAGEVATPPADSSAGLLAAATAFFTKLTKGVGGEPALAQSAEVPPRTEPANDNEAQFAAIGEAMTKMAAAMTKLGEEFRQDMGTMRTEQSQLKASIETTENPRQPRRDPATGGAAQAYKRAEC